MNTRIEYLYRDADNYKVHNECVIEGELTDAEIEEIIGCLNDGEYFIPSQVGLPETRFKDYDPDSDHCWFELSRYGFFKTNEKADGITAQELLENFQKAKDNWDDSIGLLIGNF